jgi:hypothetical protein
LTIKFPKEDKFKVLDIFEQKLITEETEIPLNDFIIPTQVDKAITEGND